MNKFVDPNSGVKKLYKGPGRTKDKNLSQFETPAQQRLDDLAFDYDLWNKLGRGVKQKLPVKQWTARPTKRSMNKKK